MSSIYAFTKRIKEEKVIHQEIPDSVDIMKIGEVIQKLEALPKSQESRLDELALNVNPRKWVSSLIRGYPDSVNNEEMEYLLTDFTDEMRTRMREESKYAIGLLMQNELILCHSFFGEETITPEWKIIQRMLDTDNVLRYVSFRSKKGILTVRFWEREATSSFIEWLGLPRKQAFLFGGRYRIRCEIEDITTEFQLTEQEMERWLQRHSEFREGTIKFSIPVQLLSITEIMAGRKRYDNPEDFMQDYEAENWGIVRYQREYERINGQLLPLLMKYYDEKTQVVRIEAEEENTEVTKATPGFDILFVNDRIEFRKSYLKDLVKRFINGEPMKIVHAGVKFKSSPFVLGSMEIYNGIEMDYVTQQIVKYYNDIKLPDSDLVMLLRYAIFKKLAEINSKSPVSHFFERLSQETMKLVSLKKKWTKLEDKVLEYKSADIFAGSNEEIIGKLSEDLKKKLKESPCKIYFIGVEDDGTIHPIFSSRLKSDRIESIRNSLQDVLCIDNIYICSAIQEEKGILVIMALQS